MTGVSMILLYRNKSTAKEAFSFTFSAIPIPTLTFTSPAPDTNRPFKRRRALSDVDGDGNKGRKKRRLRLHLITSRLSRPFSQPATNIVNRGVSKVAVWGRNHKGMGSSNARVGLRKAAIMNRVRMQLREAKDVMMKQQESRERERERETTMLSELAGKQPMWRCHELPPSPLGLSNYDALDLEDDMWDEEGDGEGGLERCSEVFSDFNIINPTNVEGDGYDFLDALDGITPDDLPEPPPPPEEGIADILREKERQGESYFVPLQV